ncbi:MAG: hypothetical protein H8D96_07985 [Desulfobacterales bacterium]|uniref:Lipoprotein n=1 Tax=Candidatus Desulfatibia vada TaxID=2841696 RepID=A0A8J6P138_9BACT|nr:hypothetical protein [Candidatus Desulfatibia vada]
MIGANRFAGRFICLGLILLMAGCTSFRKASRLVEYMNQDILAVSELELNAFKHYAAITGKNFTTNAVAVEVLKNDVIPAYGRFVYLLRKIEPQTDEVRRLHAILIRGSEIIDNGFKVKLTGHERQDENLIRIADEEIRKGVKETFKWRTGITTLYKKYNIAQKER